MRPDYDDATSRNGLAPQAAPARSALRATVGACGRGTLFILRALVPICLLAAVVVGIGYVRLSNGPLTLTMLSEPIAKGIAADLDGLTAEIKDTQIALGDRGIEVRLIGLRLLDSARRAVAIAPIATIDLSAAALWHGRLAPRHVVLIEPRMLLSMGADGRIALTMSQPSSGSQSGLSADQADRTGVAAGRPTGKDGAGTDVAPVPGSHASPDHDTRPAGEDGRLDVARALADVARRARLKTDTSAFLRSIGLRDAGLYLDSGGRRTAWRLPKAAISLRHSEDSSHVTVDAEVVSEGQTWNLSLTAVDDESIDAVRLNVTLRDLVPHTLARINPAWTLLEGLKLPIGVSASVLLSRTGEMQSWRALVALGEGDVGFAAVSGLRAGMSGGTLDLRYEKARRQIDLLPSRLSWSGGQLTFAGAAAPSTAATGEQRWAFEIGAADGQLKAPRGAGKPIDISQVRVRGEYQADTERVEIREASVKVGATTMEAKGWLGGRGSLAERVNLEGRVGAMDRATIEALWPRALSPALHDWVAGSVEAIQIAGGNFRIGGGEPQGNRHRTSTNATPGAHDLPMMVNLEIGSARFRPAPGLPPVDVKRALYRLEGNGFEFSLPEASLDLGQGRAVALSAGRIATANLWDPGAEAEVSFRLHGGLAEAVELVEQPIFGIGRSLLPHGVSVQGKAEGQFSLKFDLFGDPQRRVARAFAGTAAIQDGRIRNLASLGDVRSLGVSFELTDKAISANGNMLISGVPAKLAWQRILSGGGGEQPPLRITATLDNADRRQLGVDLSHVLQGEIAVETTVPMPALPGQPKAQVRIDLSAAELFIQSLAWAKPPGRTAALQFDVFEADKSARARTELRSVRLVGDGIAIEGSAQIDAKGQLRQFELPHFTINTVTRLAIKGELQRDNVWKVSAEGPTFNGQDVFRSLFAISGASRPQSYATKSAPGLELEARIANVIGFSETSWRGVTLKLSKRNNQMTSLFARGSLDGGKSLEVGLQTVANSPRRMVALSDDAGQTFRLVGFYPNMQGGVLRLDANLDNAGDAGRTGVVQVNQFQILGDAVLGEVFEGYAGADANQGVVRRRVGQRGVTRQTLLFDRLRAPFSVGNGQFVLREAELRGPLLGASLSGKIDYLRTSVDISGTYVPLQALNSALAAIPGLGQLLTGPRGDGVWAMNFAIQGPMDNPEVIVHPLSMVAPGIFRDLFMIQGAAPRLTAPPPPGSVDPVKPRSSASTPARASNNRSRARRPAVTRGWTSETQRP